MQELQKFQQALDSREVAELLNKRHSDLMRDIAQYEDYLSQNADLRFDNFFVKSNYVAGTGKTYNNYLITKKGCEFLAHKMTGQKGAVFTAKYIELFHKMEQGGNNQFNQLLQSQMMMTETLMKIAQMLSPKEEANEVPVLQVGHTQDFDMDELIQRQHQVNQKKMESFPKSIRKIADTLLTQKERNFSYVSRTLTAMGYSISHTAVRKYYYDVFEGGKRDE